MLHTTRNPKFCTPSVLITSSHLVQSLLLSLGSFWRLGLSFWPWYVSNPDLQLMADFVMQWSQVAPSPSRLSSLSILSFIVCLGAFEGLLFWYWVDLKLGQVLLYGAGLAIPTVFTGKAALSNIGSHRLGRK